MRYSHSGKMRKWFDETTQWSLVELDRDDLAKLVFLESDWTKNEGLVRRDGDNYRILERVAQNAIDNRYLERPSAERHRLYYHLLQGSLHLADNDRIAICSAEPCEIEQNPIAEYYLLDGVGRCLPYMILLKQQKLEHGPVEAFLAKRVCGANTASRY